MQHSDLLLGLAIGDAYAAGLEFQDRDWIRQPSFSPTSGDIPFPFIS